jgi:hypothetical protein
MTKEQAMAIRSAQLRGEPVTATELQGAIAYLARKRDRRCRLPQLTEAVRARVNLTLVWNLWQATERAQ